MKIIKGIAAALICLTLSIPVLAQTNGISDYAGGAEAGYRDGERLKALFNITYGMAVDQNGNLIVADSYNNKIRKITGDKVETIAGFSDKKDSFGLPLGGLVDGDAAKAMFDKPRYVAVDSEGAVFVSDTGNHAIRKIAGGKVSTIAGSGTAGFADGKGNVALINTPMGIAMDKDRNLYFADSKNHVIRKVGAGTNTVTTFAGKPGTGGYADGTPAEAMFNEPSDIAFDKNGVLYVLDSGNQLVRKISNGQVTTVAGTRGEVISGTSYAKGKFEDGFSPKFNFPKGLDIADNGTIFIADTWNHRVRAIRPNGETMTLAGTGKAGRQDGSISEAMLNGPVDVVYKSGNLYISDMWNSVIRTIPVDVNNFRRIISREELIQGISFEKVSDKIQVWIDKQNVEFPDVGAYIDEGRTMVPIRFICEKWGAQVNWLEQTGQVEIVKGSFKRVFSVGQGPVKLKDGRTVIHIRHLAEEMGFYIDWLDEHRAVVISTGN